MLATINQYILFTRIVRVKVAVRERGPMVKDSPSGPKSAIKMLHKDEHALGCFFSLFSFREMCT